MERETTIGNKLQAMDDKVRYDAACKRLLSEKIILAWIMKSCLEEYRDYEVKEIARRYIEGEPQVGTVPVGPDESAGGTEISGLSTEDATMTEGTVTYDIRFAALAPVSGELIRLIINVEAQKEFHPGYSLITRGIFYGARMLSSQKGTEFIGRDYDNIRKVYSIWICMNAPDYIGNAISYYNIQKSDAIPGIPDEKETYDKISVVMICLNPKSEKGNRLTKMLGILLSPRLETWVKIYQLEHEFDIPMENDMGEELNQMCNLSDYVEELGIEKGIEKQGKTKVVKIAKGKAYTWINER